MEQYREQAGLLQMPDTEAAMKNNETEQLHSAIAYSIVNSIADPTDFDMSLYPWETTEQREDRHRERKESAVAIIRRLADEIESGKKELVRVTHSISDTNFGIHSKLTVEFRGDAEKSRNWPSL